MKESDGIAAGRLEASVIQANFADAHPPLSSDEALVEANRCYFCHDAPCVEACPTGIDIPGFIRRIATGNLRGSAMTIFRENIFGGTCARVCPTEILCERSCVRMAQEERPVNIGALQRHATDWLMAQGEHPFARAPRSGRRVAVVGAGPAGLACAHRLALHGHEVVVFEARPNPGGLNEYGIAAYKMADAFATREVDFILGIGGITIEHGHMLGRDLSLTELRDNFDAVFLGIGLPGVKTLGLAGENLAGVQDAVAFIAALRQEMRKERIAIGQRVVVIGGGNTAIDAAVQSKLLGAEEVTIVYRRGPEAMSATADEQEWAQINGVTIRHFLAPVALEGTTHITGVTFARTQIDAAGRMQLTGRHVTIPADMVLKAVGQDFIPAPLEAALQLENNRIAVDPVTRATSLPRIYAGGDCIAGPDLTVNAVEDGKRAAEAIHAMLEAQTLEAKNG